MQAETAVSLHFEAVPDQIHPSEWRVEAVNSTGDVFVAIFCGPLAKERAEEYANCKNAS
jgi:hypothetical protein